MLFKKQILSILCIFILFGLGNFYGFSDCSITIHVLRRDRNLNYTVEYAEKLFDEVESALEKKEISSIDEANKAIQAA